MATEKSLPFFQFARDLTADIANTDGWHLNTVEQMVADHFYDFAYHLLMHTTPAAGSTIKKFQGLSIDEILARIPDKEE